jgi:hypothetical protein
VSEIRSLGELRDAASAVLSWSAASAVPIVVIGGVAVSILSKPRTTKDVDVIVWLPDHETWSTFLASSKRFGIVARIPNALEFALQSRVLLLRHETSGVPIDVSMGALPFEELAIKRAVRTTVGDFQIPIPTPEDLLVMKAIAHRPRDLADIESVLSSHASIDEKWILATVQEFADLLDAPEIIDDLKKLMQARREKKTRKQSRGRKR